MKPLNILTLILVIVGGLNWGLVGLFNFDLVAVILGSGSVLSRAVYILVGISALWQVIPLAGEFGSREAMTQRGSAFSIVADPASGSPRRGPLKPYSTPMGKQTILVNDKMQRAAGAAAEGVTREAAILTRPRERSKTTELI